MQDNIADSFTPIVKNPVLDGHVLTDQALIVGTTNVAHGLGRPLIGWIIIDNSAAAKVYRTGSSTAPERLLSLVSDTACTVSLYVF